MNAEKKTEPNEFQQVLHKTSNNIQASDEYCTWCRYPIIYIIII